LLAPYYRTHTEPDGGGCCPAVRAGMTRSGPWIGDDVLDAVLIDERGFGEARDAQRQGEGIVPGEHARNHLATAQPHRDGLAAHALQPVVLDTMRAPDALGVRWGSLGSVSDRMAIG